MQVNTSPKHYYWIRFKKFQSNSFSVRTSGNCIYECRQHVAMKIDWLHIRQSQFDIRKITPSLEMKPSNCPTLIRRMCAERGPFFHKICSYFNSAQAVYNIILGSALSILVIVVEVHKMHNNSRRVSHFDGMQKLPECKSAISNLTLNVFHGRAADAQKHEIRHIYDSSQLSTSRITS